MVLSHRGCLHACNLELLYTLFLLYSTLLFGDSFAYSGCTTSAPRLHGFLLGATASANCSPCIRAQPPLNELPGIEGAHIASPRPPLSVRRLDRIFPPFQICRVGGQQSFNFRRGFHKQTHFNRCTVQIPKWNRPCFGSIPWESKNICHLSLDRE